MESTDKAIEALVAVRQSVDEIKAKLEPFLRRRHDERSASCNSAIALSLGTLCFMGARLRGKKPDDELRTQLNQMRSLLKQAQKQDKDKLETRRQMTKDDKTNQSECREKKQSSETEKQKSSKRLSEDGSSKESLKKKPKKR